jgi:hypothetical protein
MTFVESVLLNKRSTHIHITWMTFSTLFFRDVTLFNNSRMRTIFLVDYNTHVMRYQDDRFVRHSQFRYWVFNNQLREQAAKVNRWWINKISNKMIDINILRNMISNKNNHLVNIIARQANCLRETRSFWNSKRQKLKIMIRDLSCSSLFLTFSATDMQWNDLYIHMLEYDVYLNTIVKQKYRLMFRLLQKNSHVVIEYLNRRFRLFFEKILKKKFEIKDFWYRFEWQTRENDHIHDFVWLKNIFSFDQLNAYLIFWSSLIIVINFEDALFSATRHSSSVSFFERNNVRLELVKLLNRVQKHIVCTFAYCLR